MAAASKLIIAALRTVRRSSSSSSSSSSAATTRTPQQVVVLPSREPLKVAPAHERAAAFASRVGPPVAAARAAADRDSEALFVTPLVLLSREGGSWIVLVWPCAAARNVRDPSTWHVDAHTPPFVALCRADLGTTLHPLGVYCVRKGAVCGVALCASSALLRHVVRAHGGDVDDDDDVRALSWATRGDAGLTDAQQRALDAVRSWPHALPAPSATSATLWAAGVLPIELPAIEHVYDVVRAAGPHVAFPFLPKRTMFVLPPLAPRDDADAADDDDTHDDDLGVLFVSLFERNTVRPLATWLAMTAGATESPLMRRVIPGDDASPLVSVRADQRVADAIEAAYLVGRPRARCRVVAGVREHLADEFAARAVDGAFARADATLVTDAQRIARLDVLRALAERDDVVLLVDDSERARGAGALLAECAVFRGTDESLEPLRTCAVLRARPVEQPVEALARRVLQCVAGETDVALLRDALGLARFAPASNSGEAHAIVHALPRDGGATLLADGACHAPLYGIGTPDYCAAMRCARTLVFVAYASGRAPWTAATVLRVLNDGALLHTIAYDVVDDAALSIARVRPKKKTAAT